LLDRVETRVAEMRARGEEVRIDDTPEVLSKRLASYRALTEPLIHYYSERRKLLTVDGMMTIEHVTREINRILAAIGAVEPKGTRKPARKAAPAKRAAAARKPKKAVKAVRRAGKLASREAKKPVGAGKAGSARKAQKSAKKVMKKRAKR
jgi:adenylate kinase